MQNKTRSIDIRKLTYLAILSAIVFLLQIISFFMRGPVFSLTFVLVPIVIGVALCGFSAGPWLGFVFGIAVLVTGDANLFLAINWYGTVITVLLKGIFAGAAAAAVYTALVKFNKYLAVVIAALTAPVVNSGVFFLGCLVFFRDYVASLAGDGPIALFIITGFIGFNFLIEVAVNVILVPTIYRIININKRI
jgi:uncharacterized membrane protein